MSVGVVGFPSIPSARAERPLELRGERKEEGSRARERASLERERERKKGDVEFSMAPAPREQHAALILRPPKTPPEQLPFPQYQVPGRLADVQEVRGASLGFNGAEEGPEGEG